MVDFKYYINNDYFKIGRFGDKHVKKINIALLVIICVTLITAIFYFMLYSSTNLNSYDELEDYIKEQAKKPNKFSSINLAMKVMPSYNTKNNVLYMDHSKDYRKTQIPGTQDLMEKLEMNTEFFFINDTVNLFPSFDYNSDNIPLGNSIDFCISASWASKDRGFNYEIMKPIKNFTQCSETQTDKFIWNEDDTKFGLDVPAWRQNVFEANCDDERDCEEFCKSNYKAKFLDGKRGKKCYSYHILENICMVVEYNNITDSLSYYGGCYKDGLHYTLIPANIDEVYKFDSIEMEIRNKDDPIIYAGKISNNKFDFGQSFTNLIDLFNILFALSVLGLILIVFFIFYYKRRSSQNNLMYDSNKDKSRNSA